LIGAADTATIRKLAKFIKKADTESQYGDVNTLSGCRRFAGGIRKRASKKASRGVSYSHDPARALKMGFELKQALKLGKWSKEAL
jgi:hypothetical protein